MRGIKRTSQYAILEARGLSNITEGREFVVSGIPKNYGQPTDDNRIFLRPGENYPKEVKPVDEHSPFSCAHCGELFKRSLVSHNIAWMYTVFHCASHPYEVALLDVFPKVSMDTTHDWGNSFMGLDTLTAEQMELGISSIEGLQLGSDWIDENKRHAKARYIITPEDIRREGFRRWSKGRLSSIVKLGNTTDV